MTNTNMNINNELEIDVRAYFEDDEERNKVVTQCVLDLLAEEGVLNESKRSPKDLRSPVKIFQKKSEKP